MKTQNFKRTLAFLRAGKTVVFPTDTVYGLFADATNKKAVARVSAIKKRSKGKPFPLFVATVRIAKQLAEISTEQERFLRFHWPGAFTAVLKRKKSLIKLYGVSKATIALRIPGSPQLRSLLKSFGKPIIATSANLAGKNSCKTLQETQKQLGTKPDLFVNGGKLRGSPSRIVDMTIKPYRILR
jgi:L-threonylcarbamoyladenylate synthase